MAHREGKGMENRAEGKKTRFPNKQMLWHSYTFIVIFKFRRNN